ncbi:hypothetical protein C8R45DRAFT_933812 [Mycena sanguinolenta]|nr:hypothetical protein C8R45DRAFT_933812 [Mycena sanguinolenta]
MREGRFEVSHPPRPIFEISSSNRPVTRHRPGELIEIVQEILRLSMRRFKRNQGSVSATTDAARALQRSYPPRAPSESPTCTDVGFATQKRMARYNHAPAGVKTLHRDWREQAQLFCRATIRFNCNFPLLRSHILAERPVGSGGSITYFNVDAFFNAFAGKKEHQLVQIIRARGRVDPHVVHPKTTEFIMRMSAFFEMRDGMEQRSSGAGTASIRLSNSSSRDASLFGYFWLTVTKAKIAEPRAKIAFDVPHSMDCNTRGDCAYAWSREWTENVRSLIHPADQPISCLGLLHQLRNVRISELCDKCHDLTVTWIWGKQLLTKEEDLINKAIAALHELQLQVNEPLRVVINDTRVVWSSDL